ncbi:hypothetical protein GCM10020256_17540 [Streptomyces thermocoprophilus]
MSQGEQTRTARVVVADDQTVVREGIVMLLGLLPGIEVVGSAADGHEAVELVAELAPDVVLMDLRMPRCDGVEATRRIRAEHPGTQVVVLTTFADDDSLFAALRAGARGYLTKDAGGDDIVRAVTSVLSGDAGLSPGVQRRLLERLSETEPPRPAPLGAAGRAHRTGAGSAGPDRRGTEQRADRPPAACLRRHREDPHQQPLRQDRHQGPGAGGALRLRERPGPPARTLSHLMG